MVHLGTVAKERPRFQRKLGESQEFLNRLAAGPVARVEPGLGGAGAEADAGCGRG